MNDCHQKRKIIHVPVINNFQKLAHILNKLQQMHYHQYYLKRMNNYLKTCEKHPKTLNLHQTIQLPNRSCGKAKSKLNWVLSSYRSRETHVIPRDAFQIKVSLSTDTTVLSHFSQSSTIKLAHKVMDKLLQNTVEVSCAVHVKPTI